MKRVASAESLAEIGHFRKVLEQNGIRCFIKNEQLSGALGEVPFLECLPELWVVSDRDVQQAEQLLTDLRSVADTNGEAWRCARCGEHNDAQFGACWKCGTQADEAEF
jgi:hypothetical protein